MALKDELLQKALQRSKKPNLKTKSKYSHFDVYQLPPSETGHKSDTNRTQSGHKVDTKQDTNRSQKGHEIIINIGNRPQTEHATEHNRDHKPNTNRPQTDHKVDTNIEPLHFSSFIGVQRRILLFFYQECVNQRTKITRELTREHIADALKIKAGSIKTSIQRLEEKQAVKRINFKNGRGGWSQYELADLIYKQIMEFETGHKLNTNRPQTEHKVDTQPNTQPNTKPSSSSSNVINNKTTTTELPPEWYEIDLSNLHKLNIRFGTFHIIKNWDKLQHFSAFDFQESVDGFAFDIEKGHFKPRTAPLNFLLGVIQGGGLYNPTDNYISPERERIKQIIANAEKRKHETFLAWAEENRDAIIKYLESNHISYAIGFKCGSDEAFEFVKRLYQAGKLT